MSQEAIVFIVDDDDSVRDALGLLLESVHLPTRKFPSADAFLKAYDRKQPGCLVLDIRMPGMSGLELQKRLRELGATIPIIFITGHGDVPMAVQSMKSGAADFIQKPFRDEELLQRIREAIALDETARSRAVERDAIRKRIDTLTPRERDVLARVVDGQANKVIASDLGISERTVEVHRSHVMRKMNAHSIAELVRLVAELDIP